jgi:hypothetical protein
MFMTYSVLGIDTQTGQRVEIPKTSRPQGLYIIGIPGTGKSGLIENLIIQDIKQGLGVGLLDPHGDLTQALLAKLPSKRFVDGVEHITENDVIYLDLAEYRYPFGINLFTCDDPSDPGAVSEAASKVMHIFKKLWGKGGIVVEDAWGVLLEEILWNTTLTFLEASRDTVYTMAEIPMLLGNSTFRNRVVNHLTNRHVKDYWLRKYNSLSEKDQRDETRSTLNRVNAFLTQPIVEYIVGQAQNTIDFRSIMDERKILLMKLSKRHEAVTALIGSLVIAELLNAAYSRTDLTVNKRKQFNLYADEFQNFATEDFATLLEEARKFGIGITIAHQNRGQLDIGLKDRIRSVANLVVFKVNSKDADELAGEFDITPQEAWEEELEEESVEVLEEEWTEKIEDEVIDGIEPLHALVPKPFEHLVRNGHSDHNLNEYVSKVLKPLEAAIDIAQAETDRADVWTQKVSQERVFIQTIYDREFVATYQQLLKGKQLIDQFLFSLMRGETKPQQTAAYVEIVEALRGYIGFANGAKWRQENAKEQLSKYSRERPREASRGYWVEQPLDKRSVEGLEALVELVMRGFVNALEKKTVFPEDELSELQWKCGRSRLLFYMEAEEKPHSEQLWTSEEARKIYEEWDKFRWNRELEKAERAVSDSKRRVFALMRDYGHQDPRFKEAEAAEQKLSEPYKKQIQKYEDAMKLPDKYSIMVRFGEPLTLEDDFFKPPEGLRGERFLQWYRERQAAKAKWAPVVAGEMESGYNFIRDLLVLCIFLYKPEMLIHVPSGQYQPRMRTQIHLITHPRQTLSHPRIAIMHPQRTYADMLNEVASELVNLPLFTARVKIIEDGQKVEYTVKTLDPKQLPDKPLFGQALQERIDNIKEQNIQSGYLRKRSDVEEEIIKRQEQPPESEPPISRRQPH